MASLLLIRITGLCSPFTTLLPSANITSPVGGLSAKCMNVLKGATSQAVSSRQSIDSNTACRYFLLIFRLIAEVKPAPVLVRRFIEKKHHLVSHRAATGLQI